MNRLTALDARLRETLRAEMNALLRELRVTSIYVTHDQSEAMALADRIVVMSAGALSNAVRRRDPYQPAKPRGGAIHRHIEPGGGRVSR